MKELELPQPRASVCPSLLRAYLGPPGMLTSGCAARRRQGLKTDTRASACLCRDADVVALPSAPARFAPAAVQRL